MLRFLLSISKSTFSGIILLFMPVLIDQAIAQVNCVVPSGRPSNVAVISGKMCLDGNPSDTIDGETIKLIGYSGDYSEITRNERWPATVCNSNCDASANPPLCTSNPVSNSLSTIQIDKTTPNTGANLERIVTVGGSCNNDFTVGSSSIPGTCKGNSKNEIMPFPRINGTWGKFNITQTSSLNPCWEARFKRYLIEAQANGIIVIVSLFDENNISPATNWPRNPWNPVNNNSGVTIPDPRLVGFYTICPNMSTMTGTTAKCADTALNSLGKIQKQYVLNVVNAVQASGVRNVIFEVMNEARIEDTGTQSDAITMAAWHNTVANWATNYVWTSSVKKGANVDGRPLLASCISNTNCGSGSNGNPFLVYWRGGIDLVMLHYNAWHGVSDNGDICEAAPDAFRFGKPVIFDDDGGNDQFTNDNTRVMFWAQRTCSRAHGEIHFYHTKDGGKLAGTSAVACEEDDSAFVDCTALDAIGNNIGASSDLCGQIVSGVNCPASNTYCNSCLGRALALASPEVLTIEDGSMVPVMISISSQQPTYPEPTVTLISIDSNEEMDPSDVQGADFGTDDRAVFLRANKNGKLKPDFSTDLNGRVYRITYTLTDSIGNTSFAVATVTVP